jgi:hypothetical protein
MEELEIVQAGILSGLWEILQDFVNWIITSLGELFQPVLDWLLAALPTQALPAIDSAMMWLRFGNKWLPLDFCATLLIAYWTFQGFWIAFRMIKKFIPFLGG